MGILGGREGRYSSTKGSKRGLQAVGKAEPLRADYEMTAHAEPCLRLTLLDSSEL